MDEQLVRLRAPLTDDVLRTVRAGDAVVFDGVIYTGRDAAHARLAALLARGEPLPIDLTGQVIYYVGPAPPRPGQPIGSAGPTTSGRMDRYTPALYAAGLKATIGKGHRSPEVLAALVEHCGIYLAAVGGSGALLARTVVRADVVAFADLGPEAIYRLEVHSFPAIVVNDIYGADLYADARRRYRIAPDAEG
ncbi:MAG: TRZ/ATZ family protein [Chloroflexi bacterium]|nr:MAG: TRZ/ATZ family protein [Chloroflexota bacterium]